jgi:hypothetical protein
MMKTRISRACHGFMQNLLTSQPHNYKVIAASDRQQPGREFARDTMSEPCYCDATRSKPNSTAMTSSAAIGPAAG